MVTTCRPRLSLSVPILIGTLVLTFFFAGKNVYIESMEEPCSQRQGRGARGQRRDPGEERQADNMRSMKHECYAIGAGPVREASCLSSMAGLHVWRLPSLWVGDVGRHGLVL